MNPPESPDAETVAETTDRYGQFTTGSALVIYERQNTARWLQSDTVLAIAEMR